MQVKVIDSQGNTKNIQFPNYPAFEQWFMRSPVVGVEDGYIILAPALWTREYKLRWLESNGTPEPFSGGCCG
jgi:hypothetical protein